MHLIKISELGKKYGDSEILKGINLEIEAGDIFGLVGRSGAGKTTLLRCINGLERYDTGSLLVNGEEISKMNDNQLRFLRRKVGMIFQQFSLSERDSVYQNIALPLKCWKVDKKRIEEKIDYLLDIVELTDKKYSKARELSGGQKQRVAIARSLAMEPDILLCDEATSALDPNTTNSILQLLRDINNKLGLTIIMVTHQMSVIREICNKVAIIDCGRVADMGPVERVFLNQSKALVDLLGEGHSLNLPESGKNLKFVFSGNSEAETDPFSRFVRDVKADFRLLTADVSQYTTGNMGEFIININEDDFSHVTEVLQKHGIKWEELSDVE